MYCPLSRLFKSVTKTPEFSFPAPISPIPTNSLCILGWCTLIPAFSPPSCLTLTPFQLHTWRKPMEKPLKASILYSAILKAHRNVKEDERGWTLLGGSNIHCRTVKWPVMLLERWRGKKVSSSGYFWFSVAFERQQFAVFDPRAIWWKRFDGKDCKLAGSVGMAWNWLCSTVLWNEIQKK